MGMWSGGQSISIFISHDKARWSIPAREVNRSNAPVMLISLYHPLRDFQKGLLGVEITRPATGPTSRPNDVWPPLTQADLATAAEERPCFQPFNPMLSPYVTIPPGNQTTFWWQVDNVRPLSSCKGTMIHSDLDMTPDQYKNLYFLPLESQPNRLRRYRMFGPLSARSCTSLSLDQGIRHYSTIGTLVFQITHHLVMMACCRQSTSH